MAPFTDQEKHVGTLALLMFAVEERHMFSTEQLIELDRISQSVLGVGMTQGEAGAAAISLLKRIVG